MVHDSRMIDRSRSAQRPSRATAGSSVRKSSKSCPRDVRFEEDSQKFYDVESVVTYALKIRSWRGALMFASLGTELDSELLELIVTYQD